MRTALRAATVATLVLGLAGCGWFGARQDAEPAAAAAPASHAALKYEPAPVPPRQFFEK